MSTAISVRVPDKLANAISKIAEETQRSQSFHIRRAIQWYVGEFADVQIALDRLRDRRDPVLSSRELRKFLGL